jgi:hypothetical protein
MMASIRIESRGRKKFPPEGDVLSTLLGFAYPPPGRTLGQGVEGRTLFKLVLARPSFYLPPGSVVGRGDALRFLYEYDILYD